MEFTWRLSHLTYEELEVPRYSVSLAGHTPTENLKKDHLTESLSTPDAHV